jgi:type IV secretion system protein VirD4
MRGSRPLAKTRQKAGGLEQARHPAQEIVAGTPVDPAVADPLGLGEDEGDAPPTSARWTRPRARHRPREPMRSTMADHRPGDLQLDF